MKFGIALGYVSKLSLLETIQGMEQIKKKIKESLKVKFSLIEVNSSIVTDKHLWLNDDNQQTKRPIDFDISYNNSYGEILQSNNKWRRYFLGELGLKENNVGIFTDFQAIERDSEISNISSVTYHEFGMEIIKTEYNIEEVNKAITGIFQIISTVDKEVSRNFTKLNISHFGNTLIFVTHKKLKELYPLLTFNERINRFGRDNGSFVLQDYVEKLLNQSSANQFSSDIFDFKTFSKIYYYNSDCEKVVSIGYVSYTVDREMLKRQNNILKENVKTQTQYHHLLKSNKLPMTLSCGIFIDRITMGILEKQHIGEVQSSIWDQDFLDYCNTNNIKIL
ncbi:hypothetical protein [Spiroplasma tabanidicola]|uniref:Asparagine synthetase AsnA n=1 Tax=Spiroplasma tabanidicola TaxID=324079 RepID=A0A6I6C6I0_9MOLU|nr:hypothetical protein [Spiroplasma tabanidicola]QGS51386.1 asparagine synthetase AsnA [Spiroplasma tabanidicola]